MRSECLMKQLDTETKSFKKSCKLAHWKGLGDSTSISQIFMNILIKDVTYNFSVAFGSF